MARKNSFFGIFMTHSATISTINDVLQLDAVIYFVILNMIVCWGNQLFIRLQKENEVSVISHKDNKQYYIVSDIPILWHHDIKVHSVVNLDLPYGLCIWHKLKMYSTQLGQRLFELGFKLLCFRTIYTLSSKMNSRINIDFKTF